MIGNITKGADFGGLFRYLLKPSKDAEIIGGNVGGLQPNELEAEFLAFSSLNERVKKVVTHISIGFAAEDGKIKRELQDRIGARIVEEMGYGNAQYLIVSHGRNDPGHDEEHHHDHLHIVANSVDLDGKFVNDRLNYPRLEKILRQIEQDEELRQIESSWEVKKRAPSHGQTQRYKREVREVAAGTREVAILPVSDRLQSAIDLAATQSHTVIELARKLAERGISTKLKVTRTGKVQGISYGMEGVSYQGNQLYDASLPKLQSARGLTFNVDCDPKIIRQISLNPHSPTTPIQITPIPLPVEIATVTPAPAPKITNQIVPTVTIKPTTPIPSPKIKRAPIADGNPLNQLRKALAAADISEEHRDMLLGNIPIRLAPKSVPSPVPTPVVPIPVPLPTIVTPPIPQPSTQTEDPCQFNTRLWEEGEKQKRAARQEAKRRITKLEAVPKRSLLNWNGITARQFEANRTQILRDLAADIKIIEQIVMDESKPVPLTPIPAHQSVRVDVEEQESATAMYLRLESEVQNRQRQRQQPQPKRQHTHDGR